uniref:Uncharacterized protein n=1 Tax=Sphaerodactylus townsendi TaxID=933632 RepID=A0ACB8EKN0_9SAUR
MTAGKRTKEMNSITTPSRIIEMQLMLTSRYRTTNSFLAFLLTKAAISAMQQNTAVWSLPCFCRIQSLIGGSASMGRAHPQL